MRSSSYIEVSVVMRVFVGSVLLALGCTSLLAAVDLPLHDAVRAGDRERVEDLLDGALDVNAVDGDGATALHWATHSDDLDIGRHLISAGATVTVATRFGATPLALAAENGSAPFIELLLDAGADPNEANADGESVLMSVSRTGRTDAVKLLLGRGADPNLTEGWRGQTALMWAAAENNLSTVQLLIDSGADLHAKSSPTGPAGWDGSRTGAFSPLMFAVRAGHLDMIRLLLDAGANPDDTLSDGTSAIVLAAKNGHYEAGTLLLQAGADPNADDQGWTALHEIKWTRRHNLGFNNPPPIVTGLVSDLEFVRQLATHYGADLDVVMTKEPNNRYRNVLNRIGSTPFFLAAKAADVEMMRLLVELGADPLLPNEDGTTPLMVAAGVGIWAVGESPGTNEEALEAVKYALELGGDITAVDDNGDTALHGAIIRGSEPLVRFLLDRGADIEATNEKGWTPFRIAKGVFYSNTGKRWPEMESLLLELGADPTTALGADNTISDWTVDDTVLPAVR